MAGCGSEVERQKTKVLAGYCPGGSEDAGSGLDKHAGFGTLGHDIRWSAGCRGPMQILVPIHPLGQLFPMVEDREAT